MRKFTSLLLLGFALGISATYLMNIQTQYELDCAKQSERVVLQTKMLEIWNVLKDQVSIPFFRKVGIVRGNIIEDVKRIFEVFSVDNLADFFGLKAEEMELSYYRKSEKVKTNPVDILSWKYYCYHLSKNDESTDALEVKSPICSPLNSEDNELTDSITTIFSQSNVTYYGIRIWPQDEEYYQKSVENRLYLVLGINDTLVVISDNPIFFGANILSIRSKSRARKVYSRYNLNFDNDLPIRFYATSSSDTLIYEKIPIKSAPYQLSKGILKTNRLIGLPIYVGMPIKVLNRKVGIEGIIPLETLTEYKVMCVIHPEAVRSLWVDKQYIQSLKQLSHCDITMIILKLKDNKIDTIEFTNFGKYKMTDGMSVTSYLKFR